MQLCAAFRGNARAPSSSQSVEHTVVAYPLVPIAYSAYGWAFRYPLEVLSDNLDCQALSRCWCRYADYRTDLTSLKLDFVIYKS